MSKRNLFIFAAAGLFILLALLTLPSEADSSPGEWLLQTVPSRTPTPEGGPPTAPPPPPTSTPGGGGGGPQPTSQPGPTNTLAPGEPSPTATSAATVVLITPIGGYDATAEPCGTPPTVQARGVVNVREGPGLDYEPISSLVFLEVRPIIGRAEFATWWLIQLPNNLTGWVANQAVAVQGYTGAVPIVDPPELGEATPTRGPLWNPTPNPICTPLPTPTATVTTVLISTAPEEETAASTNTPTPEPTATIEETEPPTPTESPSPEPTATVTTAATATADPAASNTQEPTDGGDSPASASSWILFIGIGLVVIGAVTFFLRNR